MSQDDDDKILLANIERGIRRHELKASAIEQDLAMNAMLPPRACSIEQFVRYALVPAFFSLTGCYPGGYENGGVRAVW